MVPSFRRSWLWGKWSMFLATSRAWFASVVSLTVSEGTKRDVSQLWWWVYRNEWLFHHMLLCSLPMKFLLAEESWACFHPTGQAIRTALCFIPPNPADWMSREKPSRRLDDTTTWEKPLVRSAAMTAFKFYKKHVGQRRRGETEGQDGEDQHGFQMKNYAHDLKMMSPFWQPLVTLQRTNVNEDTRQVDVRQTGITSLMKDFNL